MQNAFLVSHPEIFPLVLMQNDRSGPMFEDTDLLRRTGFPAGSACHIISEDKTFEWDGNQWNLLEDRSLIPVVVNDGPSFCMLVKPLTMGGPTVYLRAAAGKILEVN